MSVHRENLAQGVERGEVTIADFQMTGGSLSKENVEYITPNKLNAGDWVVVLDPMRAADVLLRVENAVVGNVGAVIEYVTGENAGVSSTGELMVVRAGTFEQLVGAYE